MINLEDLEEDALYDGFIWKDGRQRKVATMRWHTATGWPRGYFWQTHGDQYGYHGFEDAKGATFEPNVRSKDYEENQ